MNDSGETRSVQIVRVFQAPIELVYEAWTRIEHLTKWMKCDANATLEVEGWESKVGATYRYRMALEGKFDVTTTGRIVEATPPTLFSYITDPIPEIHTPEFKVRVELESVEGGTKLTLTHSGLPNDDFCGIVTQGWTTSLGLLEGVVANATGNSGITHEGSVQ